MCISKGRCCAIEGVTEKLIERITVIQLKNKELKKIYGLGLPIEGYLLDVEKNLETRDITDSKNRIIYIERIIDIFLSNAKRDFYFLDLGDSLKDADNLKEVKNKLLQDLEGSVLYYNKWLSYLKARKYGGVNPIYFQQIFSYINNDNRGMKWFLDKIYVFEETIKEVIDKNSDDIYELISLYRLELNDISSKGFINQSVENVQKQLDVLEGDMESERYLKVLDDMCELGSQISKIFSVHDEFEKWLNTITFLLEKDSLTETERKKHSAEVRNIVDSAYGEEEGVESLKKLSELIQKNVITKEAKSNDIITAIENKIGEHDFLSALSKTRQILPRIKKEYYEGNFNFVISQGGEYLEFIESIHDRYNSIEKLYDDLKILSIGADFIPKHLEEGLKRCGDELKAENFFSNINSDQKKFYSICEEKFEEIENEIKEIGASIEEIEKKEKQKVVKKIDSVKANIPKLKSNGQKSKLLSDIKKLDDFLSAMQYHKACDYADSIHESLSLELAKEKNMAEIERIYEKTYPAFQRSSTGSLCDLFDMVEKSINDRRADEKVLKTAYRLEEELLYHLQSELDSLKKRIRENEGLDITVYPFEPLICDIETMIKEKRITKVVERLDRLETIIEERSKLLEKYCLRLDVLKGEINSLQDTDISVDDLISNIESVENDYDPEEGLNILLSVEDKLRYRVKEHSKNLLGLINSLREELLSCQEKDICFEKTWTYLEEAYDKINTIKSFDSQGERQMVLSAEADLANASKLFAESLEKRNQIDTNFEDNRRYMDIAESLGIKDVQKIFVEDLLKKPIDITHMDEVIEQILEINTNISGKIENHISQELRALEDEIDDLNKEKCYIPFFSEEYDSVIDASDKKDYEKSVFLLNDLKERVENQKLNFFIASKKEKMLSACIERLENMDIDTIISYSRLFSYDDYEKANNDYDRTLENILKLMDDYKKALDAKLSELDETLVDIVSDSHYHPVDVVDDLKRAIDLMSSMSDGSIDNFFICPECDSHIKRWTFYCGSCGFEFEEEISLRLNSILDTLVDIDELISAVDDGIKIFEDQKSSLNINIDEIERVLSQLEKSGIDLTDVIKEVFSLTEEKEIDIAIKKSEAILINCNEILEEFKNRAEGEIEEAKELLTSKIEKGIVVDRAENILNEAILCKKNKHFVKAIRHAQESKNVAEGTEAKYQESIEKLAELKKSIERCFRAGLYPIGYAVEFEQVRYIDDYSRKIEATRDIHRKLLDYERNHKDDIRSKVETLSSFLQILEKDGINVRKPKTLLEDTNAMVDQSRYNDAKKNVVSAYVQSIKLKKSYERARAKLVETKRKLNKFKSMGVETEDVARYIKELEDKGEYDTLLSKCDSMETSLEKRRTILKQSIKDRYLEIESHILELEAKGIVSDEYIDRLAGVKESYDKEDYASCQISLTKIEDMIASDEDRYDRYCLLKKEWDQVLTSAMDAGLDISNGENIPASAPNFEDHKKAENEFEDSINFLTKKIGEKRDELNEQIVIIDKKIDSMKRKGSRVGINFFIPEFKDLKDMFDKGFFSDAEERLDSCRSHLSDLETTISKIDILIDIVSKLIEHKTNYGEVDKTLEKIFIHIQNDNVPYTDSDIKLKSLVDILNTYPNISRRVIAETFENLSSSIEDRRRKDGFKSKQIESLIKANIDEVNNKTISELIGDLYEVTGQVNLLRSKHDDYESKKSRLKQIEMDLNRVNISYSSLEHFYTRAETISDYGSALEILDEAKKILDEEIDISLEKIKGQAGERHSILDEIKNSGILEGHLDKLDELVEKIKDAEDLSQTGDIIGASNILIDTDDELDEINEKYITSMLDHLKDTDEIIQDIADNGGPVKTLRDSYDIIMDDLKSFKIIGTAKSSKGLREKAVDLKKMVIERNELMDEVRNEIERARGMGVAEIDSLNSDFERMIKDEDMERVINNLRDVKAKLNNMIEKWITGKKLEFEEIKKRGHGIPSRFISSESNSYEDRLSNIFNSGTYHGLRDILEVYASLIKDSEDAWEIDRSRIKLPFTHGIETELQIINEDGSWIEGNKMKVIFEHLIETAYEQIKGKIQNALKEKRDIPTYILENISDIAIREDKAGNKAVHVLYELNGELSWYSIIGKDSHVTTTTNILEIQTPPCTYLKELEWWLRTVFETSYDSVKKSGTGLLLVSTGMNPVEGFSKGVTFGDHHHICIPDENVARTAYNQLRNYIPHIISLSVNSPFPGGHPPEIKANPNNSLISPLTSLSSRIELNIGQLQCPPEISSTIAKDEYLGKISPDDESSRMVDISPFTRFGTIELRITDTELSISDRLSLAVFIQAISLRAKKWVDDGIYPGNVSEPLLLSLRENAFKHGLVFPISSKISEQYEVDVNGGTDSVFDMGAPTDLKDLCAALLYSLKKELHDMNVLGTQFMDPLFIKLFGPKSPSRVGAPITSAQYQLYLFQETNEDLKRLLLMLDEISRKSASNASYHPIIEEFGYPLVPEYLLPYSVDISFESFERSYLDEHKVKLNSTVSVKNISGNNLNDVRVVSRYLKEDEDILAEEILAVKLFGDAKKETLMFEKVFDLREDTLPSKIYVETLAGNKTLISKTHPITTQKSFDLNISFTGPKNIDAGSDCINIPYSVDIKNLLNKKMEGTLDIILETEDGDIKDEKSCDVSIMSRGIFASITEITSDWAINALEHQDYISVEPLEIVSDFDHGRFRLKAKLETEDEPISVKETELFSITFPKNDEGDSN